MNIAVLGGNGFLGTNTVEEIAKSHVVCVISNRRNENQVKNVKYYTVDIVETDKLLNIFVKEKIDCIIHFVSTLIPSSNSEEYICDIETVYIGTFKLLAYCAEKKIKFVYISSGGAIYGKNGENKINENTNLAPISFYGLSKLMIEELILFFHRTQQLNYLIVRPSNPYGRGQNLNGRQGVIAVFLGKILKKEKLQIWGDGNHRKDYIYISDFVYYLNTLINSTNLWNEAYNIGSGKLYTVNDIINEIKRTCIDDFEVEYIDKKKTDVEDIYFDVSKIQNIIAHKCLSLSVGLKEFWRNLNEQ